MTKLDELLRISEIRTAILTIAQFLDSDVNYKKEDAVQDLLELLENHNL